MPSPTVAMGPTSADTILGSKSRSRCLMTSLISLELIAMVPFPYLISTSYTREPAPQLLQPRRQAGVDDRGAGLDDEAAEDRPVNARCEPDLLAQPARQVPGQPLLLLV